MQLTARHHRNTIVFAVWRAMSVQAAYIYIIYLLTPSSVTDIVVVLKRRQIASSPRLSRVPRAVYNNIIHDVYIYIYIGRFVCR